ncbi:DEKNAAC103265 [Brettanomyces naardenensis]|uniref:DEKNAAC103265 n=1 Tax=Brettanomyces naardenensis TaxID=13370 RepID=A0A448YMP0_BRENA|nr:DEKNAAC103265 [Brettanomyces naardenensis]
MKVTEKLTQAHEDGKAPATFSFEFFTPKTSQGVQNLYDRMDRMYDLNPLFIDITWNAGGRLGTLTTEMVNVTTTVLGLETCMHLTCTNMKLETIDKALDSAFQCGCQNILALRGDPPLDGSESTGVFRYAKDLIRHIKSRYGNHFCIGVAGYPEGHPEESDLDKTIEYLKQKQDAGGDFIVTQMFYDVDLFISWCKKCRAAGITIPIIPGIMPISTYAAFFRRAQWCKIHLPDHFFERLEPIKEDDSKVRDEGVKLVAEMCAKLLQSGCVNHLHFYTMNLEKSTIMVLRELNLVSKQQLVGMDTRPWRRSLNPTRSEESVRPIFWSNRKFSYIQRTSNWDEFPNGRWGDSRSPAFGSLELCDHELIRHTPKKALSLWGLPTNIQTLADLTVRYLNGDLNCLPWSDSKVTHEIDLIKDDLIDLNRRGVLTVNSQASINCCPSSDKVHGWGPNDGYVYQKQYLEFLIPSNRLDDLVDEIGTINKESGYNILTFYSIGQEGEFTSNARSSSTINAVTWGCFPGKEVVQSTIVEKISFMAWKDEFFSILKKWISLFRKDTDPGREDAISFIESLVNDATLVNIVDNDYVGEPNTRIFNVLRKLFPIAE